MAFGGIIGSVAFNLFHLSLSVTRSTPGLDGWFFREEGHNFSSNWTTMFRQREIPDIIQNLKCNAALLPPRSSIG